MTGEVVQMGFGAVLTMAHVEIQSVDPELSPDAYDDEKWLATILLSKLMDDWKRWRYVEASQVKIVTSAATRVLEMHLTLLMDVLLAIEYIQLPHSVSSR